MQDFDSDVQKHNNRNYFQIQLQKCCEIARKLLASKFYNVIKPFN